MDYTGYPIPVKLEIWAADLRNLSVASTECRQTNICISLANPY
jgi:hypothetical protein